MICETGWIDSGGPRLFWRGWLSPAPRRVLRIVHGLGEHSGRYVWLGERLAERGFASYALDYRGHGLSHGPRGHVGRFDEYVGDLARIEAVARERHPDLPASTLGHSQGGLIVLLRSLDDPASAERIALSSPLLALHPDLRLAPVLDRAARLLASVIPRAGLPNRIPPSRVSRDASVVAAYASDPLVVRRVTLGWYRALQSALRKVWAGAPELALPTHLSYAGADRLVDATGCVRWASQAPTRLVQLREWPGLFHEILNEPEREQVADVVAGWLELPAQREAAAGSPPRPPRGP